jgi:hypothetical protein
VAALCDTLVDVVTVVGRWRRAYGDTLPRFGITGHVNLTPASIPLVYQAIADALTPYAGAGLTGVSCIAGGADSIFARAVLDLGGRLEVLVPAENYRAKKVPPDDAPQFDELLRRADDVRVLPFPEANGEAYEAANQAMVSVSDRVLAVWDGQHGAAKGSTASVVEYARAKGVPVEVIWPDGVERS